MTDSPNARASAPEAAELAVTDRRRIPGRLTPELQLRIEGALRVTGSIKTACAAHEVSWSTAREWLKKGREDIEAGRETAYASFVLGCEMAKAKRRIVLESRVEQKSVKDWRAAAYLIDKLDAKKTTHQQAPLGGDGQPVILLYPVPAMPGSDPRQTPPMLPGHAFDTVGEESDAEG